MSNLKTSILNLKNSINKSLNTNGILRGAFYFGEGHNVDNSIRELIINTAIGHAIRTDQLYNGLKALIKGMHMGRWGDHQGI